MVEKDQKGKINGIDPNDSIALARLLVILLNKHLKKTVFI